MEKQEEDRNNSSGVRSGIGAKHLRVCTVGGHVVRASEREREREGVCV